MEIKPPKPDHTDSMNDEQLIFLIKRLEQIKNTDTTDLWTKVTTLIRLKHKRRQMLFLVRYSVAAAVLLGVLSGIWYYREYHTLSPEPLLSQEYPQNITLTLSDGSNIILDQSTSDDHLLRQNRINYDYREKRLVHTSDTGETEKSQEIKYNTLYIPKGTTFDILLQDGSRVWLNAGSVLRYPTDFHSGDRRLFLEGEAYMQVTPNSEKPFIVETAGQILTVLGTEFNICAYPGEMELQTTLASGSISLTFTMSGQQTLLQPGQQLRLDNQSGHYSLREVNIDDIACWRDGKFSFNNQTLQEISYRLARWYDVKFIFEDPEIANLVLIGNLPMYDRIDKIIEVLEASGKISLKKEGNLIRVSAIKKRG